MIGVRVILDCLLRYILLITILGLGLSFLNYHLSCQIENYTDAGENATFNTIFKDIKYLEAHLNRIDEFNMIIAAHLDFIDSHQNIDSEEYKIYKNIRARHLLNITNKTNPAMMAFAKESLDSSNYSSYVQEQRQPVKDLAFFVMIAMIFVNFLLLGLQFYQKEALSKIKNKHWWQFWKW